MVYNAKSKKIKKRGEKKVERKRTHNLTKCREKERQRARKTETRKKRERDTKPTNRQKFTIFQFGTVTGERESLYR